MVNVAWTRFLRIATTASIMLMMMKIRATIYVITTARGWKKELEHRVTSSLDQTGMFGG
jgi:hypothetical protein